MKKIFSIVALLAMVLLASSAYYESDSLVVGDKAPEFTVSNTYGSFDLNQFKGKYVLLTFWSSSDAKSRIDCNAYSHWTKVNAPESLKHVALNFDSTPELFQEIVRLDDLDSKAQFNVKGQQADYLKLHYGLLEGFGSLLISPDGRILAFNPSTSDLSLLI